MNTTTRFNSKIISTVAIIIAISVFNAHAEKKIEAPKIEIDKKTKSIGKPVSIEKLPVSKEKGGKASGYVYTAIFLNPIKNGITKINAIKWSCKDAIKCMAKHNASSLSVNECAALVKVKKQRIKAFGHDKNKFSTVQIKQCNKSVKPDSKVSLSKKNQAHKNGLERKTNLDKPVAQKNSKSLELNKPKLSETKTKPGLKTNKGLGGKLNSGVKNSEAIRKVQINSNAFSELQANKMQLSNQQQELIRQWENNPHGGSGQRFSGDDCNDTRRDANPNTAEVCDNIDNDCDGEIDEGQTVPYFLDADGDTHGDPTKRVDACPEEVSRAADEGRWLVRVGNDCDDNDPERWNRCN